MHIRIYSNMKPCMYNISDTSTHIKLLYWLFIISEHANIPPFVLSANTTRGMEAVLTFACIRESNPLLHAVQWHAARYISTDQLSCNVLIVCTVLVHEFQLKAVNGQSCYIISWWQLYASVDSFCLVRTIRKSTYQRINKSTYQRINNLVTYVKNHLEKSSNANKAHKN